MADETRPLLSEHARRLVQDDLSSSMLASEDYKLVESSVGERLAYNDYTTIDYLHDLVQDSYRLRFLRARKGCWYRLVTWFDQVAGWIVAALVGAITACVAFLVDISAATVSDWKQGYCIRNPFLTRDACCTNAMPSMRDPQREDGCSDYKIWSTGTGGQFAAYLGFALLFGLVSGCVTLTTRRALPAVAPGTGDEVEGDKQGKSLVMAAGSGIPEIKTILAGFVIPNYLDFKVLLAKAVGSIFAVSTGMCLGKEGPFVHISACCGELVARRLEKFRGNGRKMREMLSASCAAGLSVAFGAPIGGVLFAYEEIATYLSFPRKVLWRAFLCSLCAAIVLRALNPTGTGKLILFETTYGAAHRASHYPIFVFLGLVGGVFGGLFCRLNFAWSTWFRSFRIIKDNPVLEVFVIVLATVCLQWPNPLTREAGEVIVRDLLVNCQDNAHHSSWICQQEASNTDWSYRGYLVYGSLTKLVLTIITFGVKVPSGVIIPALDAGALFGRLIGITIPSAAPGVFAMVGASAFLAGVSRMTISLCVIMFELTGELEYVVPHMIAILTAKWVADAIGKDGVYDLAQSVLGHPFLDLDRGVEIVQKLDLVVADVVPPRQTMDEITVIVPQSNKVPRSLLATKLEMLERRGLMDAGLAIVQSGSVLQGYLHQAELDFGLNTLGRNFGASDEVRLLGNAEEGEFDLSHFVDRSPISLPASAPLEYAVEVFGKLGVSKLMVTEEGTGRLVGVVIKKRLVDYLDKLSHG